MQLRRLSTLPAGAHCCVDPCLLAQKGCVALSCARDNDRASRRLQPHDTEDFDVVIRADTCAVCTEDGLGGRLVELRYVICALELPRDSELAEERVQRFFQRVARSPVYEVVQGG